MLFNSLAFVVAFPLFCAAYFAVPPRAQRALVLAASLATCALTGWMSFAWLLAITVSGFVLAGWIAAARSANRLWVAVAVVVMPLLILKYTDFAIGTIELAVAWWGGTVALPHLGVAMPVGLSFYTFVVIGYLADVYLSRVEVEPSLARFAVLTSFFPKFVSGPVERAGNFLPQVDEAKYFQYARVTDGIRIIGWGFFKKLVVADRLGVVVDAVYANPASYHGFAVLLAMLFYMFQVYYDFSAYSEIAVGVGRILGYELTWNFNRPYAARSVTEYWRRWHISLTTWFFDYIFWPLAATLRAWKGAAVIVAMLVTFTISGLWHGAQWSFVLFGILHSMALSSEYLTARRRKRWQRAVPARLYAVLGWGYTFSFLALADVIFRSRRLEDVGTVLTNLFSGLGPDAMFLARKHFSLAAVKSIIAGLPVLKEELLIGVAAIAVVEIVSYLGKGEPLRVRLGASPAPLRWALYYAVAGAIVFLGAHNTTASFLYVQF